MKPKMIEHPKLYPQADPQELKPYYARHVAAMTRENLNSKADIAVQLALRDKEIADLKAELVNARSVAAEVSELYRREHEQIAPLLAAAACALPEPEGVQTTDWPANGKRPW